jgi:hypothetical protein
MLKGSLGQVRTHRYKRSNSTFSDAPNIPCDEHARRPLQIVDINGGQRRPSPRYLSSKPLWPYTCRLELELLTSISRKVWEVIKNNGNRITQAEERSRS